MFSLDTNLRKFLSFNIWYCLKALKKKGKEKKEKEKGKKGRKKEGKREEGREGEKEKERKGGRGRKERKRKKLEQSAIFWRRAVGSTALEKTDSGFSAS